MSARSSVRNSRKQPPQPAAVPAPIPAPDPAAPARPVGWLDLGAVFVFALAVRLYSELLASIRASGGRSGYNEAECLFKLMKAFDGLGDKGHAVLQAKAILALRPSSMAVESRIKKHRKAGREFLEKHAEKKEAAAGRLGE